MDDVSGKRGEAGAADTFRCLRRLRRGFRMGGPCGGQGRRELADRDAVAMRLLAAQRDSLDRDVILLGTAAEEGGDQGIDTVITKHFDLIKDAEFALNEGGRVRARNGKVFSINIQVTEKISYVVTATARGTSGHGSVPLPDNPIAALSRALSRVHGSKQPARRPKSPARRSSWRRSALRSDCTNRNPTQRRR